MMLRPGSSASLPSPFLPPPPSFPFVPPPPFLFPHMQVALPPSSLVPAQAPIPLAAAVILFLSSPRVSNSFISHPTAASPMVTGSRSNISNTFDPLNVSVRRASRTPAKASKLMTRQSRMSAPATMLLHSTARLSPRGLQTGTDEPAAPSVRHCCGHMCIPSHAHTCAYTRRRLHTCRHAHPHVYKLTLTRAVACSCNSFSVVCTRSFIPESVHVFRGCQSHPYVPRSSPTP